MKTLTLLITFALAAGEAARGQEAQISTAKLDDGSTLNFSVVGEGQTIILVHGLLGDMSVWNRQQLAFASEGYRVVSYSRRHNHPNNNALRRNHSALSEATDLAALISSVRAGQKVHVVGFSYGAYTSLVCALENPDLFETLTVIEPPILPWLLELDGDSREAGKVHYDRVMKGGLIPAGAAFRSDKEDVALRSMLDAISGSGTFDGLPPFVVDRCRRNSLELEALSLSDNPFPNISKDEVRNLSVPVLILSGGESVAVARLTDPILEALLPADSRQRVIFDRATHILWIEEPVRFRNTVLDFYRNSRAARSE